MKRSIDVVIPCYRYGRYLRECVQSVLSQEVDNLRVLIIDDASPDETPAVGAALARADSRVTYWRHAVNRGHIDTYNEGIDWTKADAMLLLSADDYLLPGALPRAMELMEAHRDLGLCFGEALESYDDGTSRPVTMEFIRGNDSSMVMSGSDFVRLCAQAGAANPVPTPTAVVRTSLLKRLGGYRADLPHSGDLEMWLRLAAHGSVGVVKARQAVYRRHAANMSLTYYQDHYLADLEQRKAVFDLFFRSSGGTLPDARNLYLTILRSLADEAVEHASSAFNGNRTEVSRRLCQFALEASPDVRDSAAWKFLACKKLIGFRASSLLLPAVTRVRSAIARIC